MKILSWCCFKLIRKHKLEIFFIDTWRFCHSIEIPGNQNLKDTKGYKRRHKTNPYESRGLIQVFWRNMATLYDKEISFRLLFTYKHA